MRILSPLSGATVSGDVVIDGTITTTEATELTVGLAPQSLGDCGALVAERTATIEASTAFSFTVATALLPDDVYCVVALADDGALSHVVGDVTVANGASIALDGELPTLSLDDSDGTVSVAAGEGPFEGISTLAPVVFAAAGVLGMLVIVFVHAARRRLTD